MKNIQYGAWSTHSKQVEMMVVIIPIITVIIIMIIKGLTHHLLVRGCGFFQVISETVKVLASMRCDFSNVSLYMACQHRASAGGLGLPVKRPPHPQWAIPRFSVIRHETCEKSVHLCLKSFPDEGTFLVRQEENDKYKG